MNDNARNSLELVSRPGKLLVVTVVSLLLISCGGKVGSQTSSSVPAPTPAPTPVPALSSASSSASTSASGSGSAKSSREGSARAKGYKHARSRGHDSSSSSSAQPSASVPASAGPSSSPPAADSPVAPPVLAGMPSGNPPPPLPEGSRAIIKVFYATDRLRSTQTQVSFDGKRGDGSLHFGTFDVSIPRDHQLAAVERPFVIWRLKFKEDPKKHFVIVSRTEENEATFYSDVQETIQSSTEKQAFVFIHGFNVAFDDAIYRTAQLAYDLGFSGAPILYSWPSNGEVEDYTWDLTANDWSVPHLQNFLEALSSRTGARTIHLVAHSMGNRLLVNALSAMKQSTVPRFHQVVLTAPDIDTGIFMQLSAAVKAHSDHVTLYASANDKALKLSREINGAPRAGDSGAGLVVIDGIDTIDVSALDTGFLGHSYYGDHSSVVTDLFTLFQTGNSPSKRGLRQAGTPPKLYWLFAP